MTKLSVMGAYEAKTHFSDLLARVARGEVVTITRHGAAVARLVPVKPKATVEQRRQAISAMRDLAKGNRLRGLKIRDLMNEGRQ
jgi:prevent-host-death family protein